MYLIKEIVGRKLLLEFFCLALFLLNFLFRPLDFELLNTDDRNVPSRFKFSN